MVGNDQSPTEGRDQQILRRLANIEHRIDSLEQTTAFALRAEADRHYESVKAIFGQSRRRVQVYLAATGQRSVQEIADLLDMQQSAVSRELGNLQREGLLEVLEQEGGRHYWGKKQIDRTIRISRHLMNEYQLDEDGLPSA